MFSSKNRRRGLHVVGNHPEEEKSGISARQVMAIGALTALTGTVVGAVAMEIYRYVRPKIPIPQPPPQPSMYGMPQQNPMLSWSPAGSYMPSPSYMPVGQYAPLPFTPMGTPYVTPMMGLPPAQPQPMLPAAIPALAPDPEPLSRTQLAQWQRGLDAWQRDLERREQKGDPEPRRDR